MPQPFSFVCTARERKILQYLFKTKVATFGQIHKNLFGDVSKSNVSMRLQRLLKEKFIAKGLTDIQGKYTQIFYLMPKTVDLLFADEGTLIERYQVQSGAIEHD